MPLSVTLMPVHTTPYYIVVYRRHASATIATKVICTQFVLNAQVLLPQQAAVTYSTRLAILWMHILLRAAPDTIRSAADKVCRDHGRLISRRNTPIYFILYGGYGGDIISGRQARY